MQRVSCPLPEAAEDTKEFWEACRRHELLIQRCTKCGTYRHYPRPACHICNSFDFEWIPSTGRGKVYSFTICHQAFHPWFRDKVPYNVALVELEDIPLVRMVSNLVECENDQINIGMPVELVWVDVAGEVSLYMFRPVVGPGQ